MSVYKPRGSPYYHFDFRQDGRRFHGTTGETEKQAARRIEARERTRARVLGRDDVRVDYTLDEAAGLYYRDKAQWQSSALTTKGYIGNLLRLIGALSR